MQVQLSVDVPGNQSIKASLEAIIIEEKDMYLADRERLQLENQRLVERLAVLEELCERQPVPGRSARGDADQQYLDGLRASVGLPNPSTGGQSSRRGGGDPAGDKGGGGPGGNGGGGGNASVPGAPASSRSTRYRAPSPPDPDDGGGDGDEDEWDEEGEEEEEKEEDPPEDPPLLLETKELPSLNLLSRPLSRAVSRRRLLFLNFRTSFN
jgi:hypothetical protein